MATRTHVHFIVFVQFVTLATARCISENLPIRTVFLWFIQLFGAGLSATYGTLPISVQCIFVDVVQAIEYLKSGQYLESKPQLR